jgi:hypothetical protein
LGTGLTTLHRKNSLVKKAEETAKPSQAKPSQAKPSQAKASQGKATIQSEKG